MAKGYTAKDITVLEGIEAVRKRPGMYIGGTGSNGLHHMLWEIVDNACDEAMNGYASTITVTLAKDCSTVTVDDNGRGIPVDMHKEQGRSALEVILTTLHAGGKFNGENYITSGGLHGVGSSAVNALSSHMEARIRRDGKEWRCQVVSLSENGCLMRSPEPVPLGSRVEIQFELPNAGSIETRAETAYQIPPDLGLIFHETTPSFRRAIADFVTHSLVSL